MQLQGLDDPNRVVIPDNAPDSPPSNEYDHESFMENHRRTMEIVQSTIERFRAETEALQPLDLEAEFPELLAKYGNQKQQQRR